MEVEKRTGRKEGVDLNKITNRIKRLGEKGELKIDPIKISQKVCNAILAQGWTD